MQLLFLTPNIWISPNLLFILDTFFLPLSLLQIIMQFNLTLNQNVANRKESDLENHNHAI